MSTRTTTSPRRCLAAAPAIAISALFGGCSAGDGPELARVTGKVTLDGEPLPAAIVQFQPTGGAGTYSTALTDSDGQFELRYSRDRKGAMIGTHAVSVTTGDPDTDDETGRPRPTPERIPEQYNAHTQLIFEVESGSNEYEIELLSGDVTAAPSAATPR